MFSNTHTHTSLSQTSRALFKHRTTQLIIASSSLSHSWPSVKSHFLLSECSPPSSISPSSLSILLAHPSGELVTLWFSAKPFATQVLLRLAVQLTSECANRLTVTLTCQAIERMIDWQLDRATDWLALPNQVTWSFLDQFHIFNKTYYDYILFLFSEPSHDCRPSLN